MKRWGYAEITRKSNPVSLAELNKWGRDGWELCDHYTSVVYEVQPQPDPDGIVSIGRTIHHYFFKWPIVLQPGKKL